MIRLASTGILILAIWLANMAIPHPDNQNRFDRIAVISMKSDPDARSAAPVGRLPEDVFGSAIEPVQTSVLQETAYIEPSLPFADIKPKTWRPRMTAALVPIPGQKPPSSTVLATVHIDALPTAHT
ncbi:MAG: hypothetical protein ACR2O4_13670, partial [Hyphomicrobiaceae bacterium]